MPERKENSILKKFHSNFKLKSFYEFYHSKASSCPYTYFGGTYTLEKCSTDDKRGEGHCDVMGYSFEKRGYITE